MAPSAAKRIQQPGRSKSTPVGRALGAQLRVTDHDMPRLTAFVTNATCGHLPDLELRHRRRARCEDRIRTAKEPGLQNLPLHGFAQHRTWLAIVRLACELTAWTQLL